MRWIINLDRSGDGGAWTRTHTYHASPKKSTRRYGQLRSYMHFPSRGSIDLGGLSAGMGGRMHQFQSFGAFGWTESGIGSLTIDHGARFD